MSRALLMTAVLATSACFGPSPRRPEHTALAKNAGLIMVTAIDPAPGAPTAQLFEQHYQAALAFYQDAKYPEAIAEFEASYAIDPQPLLIFNIGQAYRKSGHPQQALVKYREYLTKDPTAERAKVEELIREVSR